jgi:hypothetical protein
LNSHLASLDLERRTAPAWNKWLLLFVAVAVTLRVATGSTANISFFVLAIFALLGRTQAVMALALAWLFGSLNPGVAAEATLGTVGRFVVIGAAATSVLIRSGWLLDSLRVSRITLVTLLLGLFLIGHSLLVSPFPDVSFLKSVSWTVVTITLFAAWGGAVPEERTRAETQLFGILVAVLVCSVPLLALPQLGRAINDTGFQGILNHPQVFGPTMALLGGWAGANLLGESNPPWRTYMLVCSCLVFVVLSEARTGGLAMVLGLVVSVLFVPWLTGQRVLSVLPGIASKRSYLVMVFGLVAAALSGSWLTERIGEYLDKGYRAEATGLADAYSLTRGVLIDLIFHNIELHPLSGIGFGIASYPEGMIIERDPLLGLPTSASIEKGVFPVAVVEELGIFGAVLVVVWLWMVVRRASRTGVAALTVVLTMLLVNMGENTFFSPGGFGLLPLILVAWAATARPAQGRA